MLLPGVVLSRVKPGLMVKLRMAVEPLREMVGTTGVTPGMVRRREVELPDGTVSVPPRAMLPNVTITADARIHLVFFCCVVTVPSERCGRT